MINQTKFSIGEITSKVFSALTSGLYNQPITAVIRELRANAYDSHVAAGVNRPAVITLPTNDNPIFSIRDFGTGLSLEQMIGKVEVFVNEEGEEREIRTNGIYTTFFESSKEGDIDSTGEKGLGSKSPFTYTDQFYVSSIKDGIKNICVGYICEETKCPEMILLKSYETSEDNGLIVSFKVDKDDIMKFHEGVREIEFCSQHYHSELINKIDDFNYGHCEILREDNYRDMKVVVFKSLSDRMKEGIYIRQGLNIYYHDKKDPTGVSILFEVGNKTLDTPSSREQFINNNKLEKVKDDIVSYMTEQHIVESNEIIESIDFNDVRSAYKDRLFNQVVSEHKNISILHSGSLIIDIKNLVESCDYIPYSKMTFESYSYSFHSYRKNNMKTELVNDFNYTHLEDKEGLTHKDKKIPVLVYDDCTDLTQTMKNRRFNSFFRSEDTKFDIEYRRAYVSLFIGEYRDYANLAKKFGFEELKFSEMTKVSPTVKSKPTGNKRDEILTMVPNYGNQWKESDIVNDLTGYCAIPIVRNVSNEIKVSELVNICDILGYDIDFIGVKRSDMEKAKRLGAVPYGNFIDDITQLAIEYAEEKELPNLPVSFDKSFIRLLDYSPIRVAWSKSQYDIGNFPNEWKELRQKIKDYEKFIYDETYKSRVSTPVINFLSTHKLKSFVTDIPDENAEIIEEINQFINDNINYRIINYSHSEEELAIICKLLSK